MPLGKSYASQLHNFFEDNNDCLPVNNKRRAAAVNLQLLQYFHNMLK